MRTVPVDIDTVILASKTADVRLTFRRRKLVFDLQETITDGQGLTDPSSLDASAYNTGVLRVCNIGNVLFTQEIADLSADLTDPFEYGAWTNRGVALLPGSRPGVHNGRIWYQKNNGDICYRDYASIATEHVVTSSLNGLVVALAPVASGVYVYGLLANLVIPDEIKGKYGFIFFVDPGGTVTQWTGSIYGDLDTPRYVDAVTLGGVDYVYVMDRAAGRVMEITRQGQSWSYGQYIVPIDAIDNITGVTLRYATVIKNQVFVICRVVNSSDNNVPVSLDAVIFGPSIYDAGILDSHDTKNYSFSRWSFLTSENIGGKLFVPGDGYVYYLGAQKCLVSMATILVGADPDSLKHVTSDFFSLGLSELENSGAQLSLQLAHDADYVQALDDVLFEFGYNGDYVPMGTYTILNQEEAGAFGLLQYNHVAFTSSYAEIIMFTPHQSYYIASQDKITTNPATMMDVVVARGSFEKVTT